MIIRGDQTAHLGRINFVQRFRGMLNEQLADSRTLPRKEVDAAIYEGLKRAEACGLRTEHAVAMFVMASWLLGTGFEKRYPVVEQRMRRLDWTDKVKALWLQSFFLNLAELLGQQTREG